MRKKQNKSQNRGRSDSEVRRRRKKKLRKKISIEEKKKYILVGLWSSQKSLAGRRRSLVVNPKITF